VLLKEAFHPLHIKNLPVIPGTSWKGAIYLANVTPKNGCCNLIHNTTSTVVLFGVPDLGYSLAVGSGLFNDTDHPIIDK
jgi:hypothetical protein